MWKVYDHEGYLAVALPFAPNWDKPVESRMICVSRVPIGRYARLIGDPVEFTGNTGVVQHPGLRRRVVLETGDWTKVVEEKPIKKPRKGRGYDWKWRYGRWEKDW